jgi:hypothetical protein
MLSSYFRCLYNALKMFMILVTLLGMPLASFASPLSVIKNKNLEFGKFIGGFGYSGRVTVNTSGERISSGGVRILGDTSSPASFTLSGAPGTHYTLTLPTSFTMISEGAHMDVSELSSSAPMTGVLPAEGVLQFTVGGTVTVNGNQPSHTYSGSFNISVN